MDNSIQRLHHVPQVKQVNRKERNSDRKDDKKGEQEFSEYILISDGDGKSITKMNLIKKAWIRVWREKKIH